MATPLFRIGARGSALSLAQTELVRARLAAALARERDAIEITPITTSGDRLQDGRLIEAGGKGLFTKELDEALRDGRIDLAVHSLKDLPTRLDADIVLACVPEREDPRDAFVSNKAQNTGGFAGGKRGRHRELAAPGANAVCAARSESDCVARQRGYAHPQAGSRRSGRDISRARGPKAAWPRSARGELGRSA